MSISDEYQTALGLSRFGLGSGPQGCGSIRGDIRELLHGEIDRGPQLLTGAQDIGDSDQILEGLKAHYDNTKQKENGLVPDAGKEGLVPSETYYAELALRYQKGFTAPVVGFNERLVMFWANHFAVGINKNYIVRGSAGVFERDAIRPHVFGRFKDMLLSVETHPTMLTYLDQRGSVGPNSKAGKSDNRGLNENLAREIMELHVMGVDSGYTQDDVTAFAKALTGWTYRFPRSASDDRVKNAFDFIGKYHEPGAQVIMGRSYKNTDFFQAADIMLDLAERPATAHFIATKLARHFVSDTPPESLVIRLADVFRRTDGDLALLSHALIESPESWAAPATKLRLPQEHLIAMLRATGVSLPPRIIARLLQTMGQPLWQPSGPNGFSDSFAAWGTPVGISSRMETASHVASQAAGELDPRAFAAAILGPRLTSETVSAISRAENVRQGLSLAMMSPEFLRR